MGKWLVYNPVHDHRYPHNREINTMTHYRTLYCILVLAIFSCGVTTPVHAGIKAGAAQRETPREPRPSNFAIGT